MDAVVANGRVDTEGELLGEGGGPLCLPEDPAGPDSEPCPLPLAAGRMLREWIKGFLRVLPHSSTLPILGKTQLRMRLWTSVSEATLRMGFTRAARPQKDRTARCFPDGKTAIR